MWHQCELHLPLLNAQGVAGSNPVTVGFRQPGSDSSSESDYDEQLAKKVEFCFADVEPQVCPVRGWQHALQTICSQNAE